MTGVMMRARRKRADETPIEESAWLALDSGSDKYDPDVAKAIEVTARRVHGMYERFTELSDLTQEAYIMATSNHADAIAAQDYGYLAFRLERDLMDHCEMAFHTPRNDANGEVRRPAHSAITAQGSKTLNADGEAVYERLSDSYDEVSDDDERVNIYSDTIPGGYNAEQIKLLLPAVWDESYAYGLPSRDDAPDEDMPRAASNKARGNSHWAYIADIKTGWATTPLTVREKRALLMVSGLGWTHEEIAAHEGVARETVTIRINTAINKIMTCLNGTSEDEEN